MLFRTHLTFSFLIALITINFLNIPNNILFLIIFLFFSLLPDIDEYSSNISKRLKPLAFIIRLFSAHRGIFHTIYLPFIISLFLFTINLKFIGLAVILGYLSHLALDSLNPKGIRPFAPLINKKIKGFIRVNSILENILFLIFLLLAIHQLIS
jgi:inner membrane protein